MLKKALASIILSLTLVNANDVDIFTVPSEPGWPVVMSAVATAEGKIPSSATFTWSFPTAPNPSCTSRGRANVAPCTGQTVDHIFPTAGKHKIVLTISDRSLPQPIIVEKEVEVKPYTKSAKRPDFYAISDAYWKTLSDALLKMKELGIYDHFAFIHKHSFQMGKVAGDQRGAAHGGPSFPVWHRAFNNVIERAIQVVSKDSDIGLPYIDWTRVDSNRIFNERRFGPNGNPGSNMAVPSGPFCNDPQQSASESCPKKWTIPADASSTSYLTRNIAAESVSFPTPQQIQTLLSLPAYDSAPFNRHSVNAFRNFIEGNLGTYGSNHNGMHTWIGGTMKDSALSFYDPVFLFHHIEADRMFFMWQQQHGCDQGQTEMKCYRPLDNDPDVTSSTPGVSVDANGNPALIGHRLSDPMYPWGLSPKQLLKATGYEYLQPGVAPEDPKVDLEEQPKATPPNQNNNNGSGNGGGNSSGNSNNSGGANTMTTGNSGKKDNRNAGNIVQTGSAFVVAALLTLLL